MSWSQCTVSMLSSMTATVWSCQIHKDVAVQSIEVIQSLHAMLSIGKG